MGEYKKGSEWRKWDLHLHTPSSYDYGNKSVTNDDIINELSAAGVSVAAITDHHLMDTTRIQNLQRIGKKKDITILPGIEFLSDARGDQPVHMIGIFAENCHLEHVWGQIENKTAISKIKGEGKKHNEVYCDLDDTISLVHELGGIITIHSGQKHGSVEAITNSLPHTVAQKADIASIVDIYELGKPEDQKGYIEKVFPHIEKRLPMIICSDNHNIKKYHVKENCWIKADPTFEGLKQIIYEPEDRLFIGERPEVLHRVEADKTRYIRSLKVSQNEAYNDSKGVWFNDIEIEFNKELTVIIGNKGSGKSAIADILGLLGNTHNHKHFSFLAPKKFFKNRLASCFSGLITWEDSKSVIKVLSEPTEPLAVEKVRYLPQHYFETLTNDLDGEGFKDTLEDVVFRHLPDELKVRSTFSELLNYKQAGINEDIELFKKEVGDFNRDIIELETKAHSDFLDEVVSSIQEKKEELSVQDKLLKDLEEVKSPVDSLAGGSANPSRFQSIEALNKKVMEVDSRIETTKLEAAKVSEDKDTLEGVLKDFDRFVQQIEDYKIENKEKLTQYGIDIDMVLNIEKSYSPVNDKLFQINKQLNELTDQLFSTQKIAFLTEPERGLKESISLYVKRDKYLTEIASLKKELSEQENKYQEYVEARGKIEKRRKAIQGSIHTPDTLLFYEELQRFITDDLPAKLDALLEKRYALSLSIFQKKKGVVSLFNEFKKPVDEKVQQHQEYLNDYPIKIEVAFKLNDGFYEKLLGFILKNKKGSFKDDGDALLRKKFLDQDINDGDTVCDILKSIITALKKDESKDGEARFVSDQIKNTGDFYSFLFELDYLEPIYELKLGDKTLNELSPGEKGTLLLVFYLMIDDEKIPLIIDQPEDNLDNKSVFQMLTKFIKLAKKQRQIIIVTHNPNLAVGADAEQVIYVEIDKSDSKNIVSVEAGSIENPSINRQIVEILEGTMPAFDKRKLKYQKTS